VPTAETAAVETTVKGKSAAASGVEEAAVRRHGSAVVHVRQEVLSLEERGF